MKSRLLTVFITVAVAAFLVVLSGVLTLNAKTGYTTLVRIDNEQQHWTIVRGHDPDISFKALRDIPGCDRLKILDVEFHPVLGNGVGFQERTSKHVDNWLDSVGIINYPGYLR